MLFQNTKEIDEEFNYEDLEEDQHVMHLWEPIDFELTENYEYVHDGLLFNFFSNFLYAIAYPILMLLNKVFFGFKVIGKENYKKIKTGKITVSNHVHPMDCTMIGTTTLPKKTFFTSLASNFKIPIVKTLITLFNTIPIPTEISKKRDFLNAINFLLKNKKSVHFYPEGSLWPYYNKLRHFKNGAFELAVNNNIPIIPCVFKFIKPTGIYKYFKSKPCICLIYLEPEFPIVTLNKKDAVLELKNRVHNKMEEKLK